MTWVKLDDAFFRHTKARAAGKDARSLFLAGLCYCAGSLTDGYIAKNALPIIAAEAEVRSSLSAQLVKVGLWHVVDGGWQVNDYRLYNRTSAEVRRERDEGRERAARSRERRANGGSTSGSGSADPSSSSPLVVSSSSSSNPVDAPPPEDDDDWATIMAKHRLADRVREVGKVRSPKKWLVTTTADVRTEFADQATKLLEQHPDWSGAQVADAIENPGVLRSVPPRCEQCDNGWVLNENGDAVPCVWCRRGEAS